MNYLKLLQGTRLYKADVTDYNKEEIVGLEELCDLFMSGTLNVTELKYSVDSHTHNNVDIDLEDIHRGALRSCLYAMDEKIQESLNELWFMYKCGISMKDKLFSKFTSSGLQFIYMDPLNNNMMDKYDIDAVGQVLLC